MNTPDRIGTLLSDDGAPYVTPVKDPNTDAVAFHIKGEDHTLGNMIQVQLLRNPEVLFAGYKVPHPLKSDLIITVRTTDKTDPKKALIQAVLELTHEFASLRKSLDTAIKSSEQH